jgi:hypothetical protein
MQITKADGTLVELGIKFNNYAIEQLTAVKGNTGGYYGFVTAIVWGGYLGHCFDKQIEPELSFGEVSDWVDEATPEQLNPIAEQFRSSKSYEKMMKKSTESTDKEADTSASGELVGTKSISSLGDELASAPENTTA